MSKLLSPITDQLNEMALTVRLMDKRQFAHQLLSLALIVCSALMIWKSLIWYTGSESPVVVVLSGSMEPAFYRGDILFLRQDPGPFLIGDIVVFKIQGKDIPIVHRVHEIHIHSNHSSSSRGGGDMRRLGGGGGGGVGEEGDSGEVVELLTKGDNNQVHDSWGIYNPGQMWLTRRDIMGRAVGFLPYFGMITIYLTDFPIVKFILLGVMGLFVIFAKDQ